nr:putative reverse transcriptase domain-containing protein [Tanacetum cinerariifolium]
EADDEPEAEDADNELEVEEAGVEPEAEGADVELEAEEPDGGGRYWGWFPKTVCYTHDLEALHRHERIREAESETSRTEIALAGGSGGTSGSGGAGGSGGTGGNADGTGVRGTGPTVPELTGCTYAIFIKCDPLPFIRTEGMVGLCQWFERLDSVFQISECKEKDRVKFAMATLRRRALT